MKTGIILLVLCILVGALTPALAQEVQELVLGVSPASATTSLKAGGSDTLKFMISTNVDIPQNVTVGFEGPNWASAEKNVYFSNTYDLFVTVSVPKYTKEGIYDITMVVCRPPDEALGEPLTAYTCLSPSIVVNVTDSGPTEWEEQMSAVKYPAIVMFIITAAALVLWKVSKIKKRKK